MHAELRQGNFKERSWFSKNVEEPVTKFIARNFFGFQPSDYLQLTGGWIVPMSESGTQFGVSETNADVMFFCATSFFAVFKLAKVSNAVIAGSELKTPIDLNGTGEYRNVKGHHVHAKAAFKDSMQYDPNKGFSISQEFMKKNGIRHEKVTATQRKLFTELAESGRPNTLAEHTRIARESLKAGGAADEVIEPLINKSLENLANQGITQPTNIPWNNR